MKNIVLLTLAICSLSACATAYRLVEQPDGTYKKVPIVTVDSVLADLNYESLDVTITNNITKIQYEKIGMHGRGTDYAKSLSDAFIGAVKSFY